MWYREGLAARPGPPGFFGGLVSVADAFHAVMPVAVTAFHGMLTGMLTAVTFGVSEQLQ